MQNGIKRAKAYCQHLLPQSQPLSMLLLFAVTHQDLIYVQVSFNKRLYRFLYITWTQFTSVQSEANNSMNKPWVILTQTILVLTLWVIVDSTPAYDVATRPSQLKAHPLLVTLLTAMLTVWLQAKQPNTILHARGGMQEILPSQQWLHHHHQRWLQLHHQHPLSPGPWLVEGHVGQGQNVSPEHLHN